MTLYHTHTHTHTHTHRVQRVSKTGLPKRILKENYSDVLFSIGFEL